MTVRFRASCSRNACHTGLRQSYSTWLSQLEALTSGGPFPATAYARRTPSFVLQNRICCCSVAALVTISLTVAPVALAAIV
jgi:hypothetical protein